MDRTGTPGENLVSSDRTAAPCILNPVSRISDPESGIQDRDTDAGCTADIRRGWRVVHKLVNRSAYRKVGIPRSGGKKESFFESTAGRARLRQREVPRDNPGRPGNDRVRLVDPVPLCSGLPRYVGSIHQFLG